MTITEAQWALNDYEYAKPRARNGLKAGLIRSEAEAVGEREVLRMKKLEPQWSTPEDQLSEAQIGKCIETLKLYEAWSDAIYGMRRWLGISERTEV